jgi:broad specificity phosphatase PhoE
VYLMRHGQSHVNLTDLTATLRDDPLTVIGRAQAQCAAEWVAHHIRPTQIYASTVARAAETAATVAAACGLAVHPDDRLREIGTAHPDGTAVAEADLMPYVPDMWGTLRPYEPVTDGGESWMQFRSRVGSFVEFLVPARDRFGDAELAAEIEDERVLVVCHAGVIEAVFEYVFEKGPWSVVAIHTQNTGISHLQYRPLPHLPDWWLHFHNRITHLPEELVT